MQRNQLSIFVAVVLLTIGSQQFGCSSRSTEAGKSISSQQPLAQLTADQQKQKEQAILAKDQLFMSLMGELVQSMSEKGPANSIQVCKTRAPEIAMEVSKTTGVRIGRTSFQLRNESNVAPAWAASFVENKFDKPVEVALPEDELGVLLPIRLQTTCTICHGTDQQIPPEVKTAIASSYPADTATGFKEGDIRGYFWIEVPELKQD